MISSKTTNEWTHEKLYVTKHGSTLEVLRGNLIREGR